MDSKVTGEENGPSLSTLQELLDNLEHTMKTQNSSSFTYLRGDPAMASLPVDVKNLPDAYLFIIDLPGVGSGGVKVELEDNSVLVISGERMREEHAEEEKYLMMERWMGKLMLKFKLPVNSNTDAVSVVGKNGVLTVTVQKLPLWEPMTNDLRIARGFRFSHVICSIWGISVVVLLVGLLFGLFRPTNLL